ncbi:integrase core domain-containing protein [Streptomyces sp. NRRL S-813]|uniref:integrase core domain-containing protein n=1 Tax=Streptomyces sp. NRRL S-813 TaxID=1463919 RepID=UPI001F415115|nr:integrase core domain-containing protein [Streptomyces sp. NRRL S-813]
MHRSVELAEYTSAAYNSLCDRLGVMQSMGRVGSCFDNAAAEAFNSLVKVEYVHRHRFASRAEARLKIATWIADFYNTRRRHSRAGGHSVSVMSEGYRRTRSG